MKLRCSHCGARAFTIDVPENWVAVDQIAKITCISCGSVIE